MLDHLVWDFFDQLILDVGVIDLAYPGKKLSDIKTALNLSQRTIVRWLKQLRQDHKIQFLGAPKTGGYYSIDSEDKPGPY